ncbi:MAG: winged helix-turn-helix transcriptional regulator [Rhodospirillales bacterium]|nr:winged helix-turn-helix transcriptional regulator [Rhodospirillales bacterium]
MVPALWRAPWRRLAQREIGPCASFRYEVDGEPVKLTGKEFGVLELLALHHGQTVTKDQFLNHLYGGMDEPDLKIIDVFVCKLRQKIARQTGGKQRGQVRLDIARRKVGRKLIRQVASGPHRGQIAHGSFRADRCCRRRRW